MTAFLYFRSDRGNDFIISYDFLSLILLMLKQKVFGNETERISKIFLLQATDDHRALLLGRKKYRIYGRQFPRRQLIMEYEMQ